jgi:AAA family ATP:ADP antiporter
MFDVREGEAARVTWMALYLVCVLFAYYILKAVSRAMFLASFDIDKLPWLYILIAAFGGIMAFVYTKIFVRFSLKVAVDVCTFFMIGSLVVIWALLGLGLGWVIYVFNVFVSLFSITLVSQGWLIAANIFTTAQAKRLYGILGVGAVFGAAFGGSFTSLTVHVLGTRNLLLASAFMVFLAYLTFLAVLAVTHTSVRQAKGAEEEEAFSFRDISQAIVRYRHLQVIIAIIGLTYIVDVMVEFQFNAMAKLAFQDNQRQLTAFLGSFYGLWLNLVTFVLQFFLTTFVVSHFGVGGALQIMPVAIAVASLTTFLAPGVYSTGAARLTEAATRYSFNRTGMELLYLPLPVELRNRTKAFTDIFVDRFSRGIGGIILVVLTGVASLGVRQLALVVLGFACIWVLLSIRAKNEYISTVRKRLAARRLDFESLRINVKEAATIRLLEETTESDNPRQITYALSLLAGARGYRLEDRLEKLVDHTSPEVRAAVYDLARQRQLKTLHDQAVGEMRSARSGDDAPVVLPAVQYALWSSSDTPDLAKRLISHPNHLVASSALEALVEHPDTARELITADWIREAAASPDPGRRVLAAIAIRVYPAEEGQELNRLLLDSDPAVSIAACRTAGARQNRACLDALLRLLTNARIRGSAIEALAAYGKRIVGTLGDVLLDTTTPAAVRRQVPRVLQRIPVQRSVDVLLQALGEQDLTVRSAVLKSLNVLRETAPKLTYGRDSVMQHIMNEAKYYYEMHAALAPFREMGGTPVARLLSATLEERLHSTIERVFGLLGLRYPPKEIYAAYLAVNRHRSDEYTAAIDFLDSVLERELKRILLPLFDQNGRLAQAGRDIFGVQPKDARRALRDLIRSGDAWLVACAVATAAELRLTELRPDIEPLSTRAGSEVGPVAQSALLALA